MARENFNRHSLRVLEEIRELLSTGGTTSLTCFNHLELAKSLLKNSKEKGKRQADEIIPRERKRTKKLRMQDRVKYSIIQKFQNNTVLFEIKHLQKNVMEVHN
jgi:hypothetical protein